VVDREAGDNSGYATAATDVTRGCLGTPLSPRDRVDSTRSTGRPPAVAAARWPSGHGQITRVGPGAPWPGAVARVAAVPPARSWAY